MSAREKNFKYLILLALYLSLGCVLVDGIFGLDIFLNETDRLSPLYRLVFLLKTLIFLAAVLVLGKLPRHLDLRAPSNCGVSKNPFCFDRKRLF